MVALFFGKNTYSYYYNPDFIEILSHKLYENYRLAIHKIRRKIRTEIFNNITFNLEYEKEFYSNACQVILENVGYETGILYIFKHDSTYKLHKMCVCWENNLENISDYPYFDIPDIIDPNNKIDIGFIPSQYTNEFYENLNQIILKVQFKQKSRNKKIKEHIPSIYSPYFWNNESYQPSKYKFGEIYSLMIIPTHISDRDPNGILICINNKSRVNFQLPNEKEQNLKDEQTFFSKEEAELTTIGAEVIGTYTELLLSSQSIDRVLKKLGHEIPKQSEFIVSKKKDIMDELKEVFGIDLTRMSVVESNLEEAFKKYNIHEKRYLKSCFNQLELAAQTLSIFSEFSTMKSLTPETVKKNHVKTNVNTFISSMIDSLNEEAKNKGNFIEFYFHPHPKDSSQDHIIDAHKLLRLAILNLINNATKYSYFGSMIKIHFREELLRYIISVENFGLPIMEHERSKIFEEGYKGDEARKLNIQGLGYGLALTKNIVEAHHGTLSLDNISLSVFNDRNIFGLFELKKIFNSLKNCKKEEIQSTEDKLIFDKLSELQDLSIFAFSHKENQILVDYKNYLLSKSKYIFENITKSYLYKQFDTNLKMSNIIDNEINTPISHIKFVVSMNKFIV
jgi:signal transduction histidine kinase